MISTKGWRQIVVDNNTYYWQVRDYLAEGFLARQGRRPTLIIRLADAPASNCSIFFSQDDYRSLGHQPPSFVFTPKLVAYCIRWSLNKDWSPTINKQPVQMHNGAEMWDQFYAENEPKL